MKTTSARPQTFRSQLSKVRGRRSPGSSPHPGAYYDFTPGAPEALAVRKQEVVHPGRPGESNGCQVKTSLGQEAWMNVHKNARLTPYRRAELVQRLEHGEPAARV